MSVMKCCLKPGKIHFKNHYADVCKEGEMEEREDDILTNGVNLN